MEHIGKYLDKKLEELQTLKEKAELSKEIMIDDLKDMEKELSLWYSWVIINKGNFTKEQSRNCLNRAKQIVDELQGI